MDQKQLATLARLGRRIWRAGRNETDIDGRKLYIGATSRFLPHLSFNRTRTTLLRRAGFRIGAGSLIMGHIDITGPGDIAELLSIGDDTFITGPLHIDLGARVRIGDRVRTGHHVALLTFDHEIGPSAFRCGQLTAAPIGVGDGAWLGSYVTVLPGVEIGAGAVVATGAVVTRDVAPNMLVAGVPAKQIRDLDDDEAPRSERRGRAVPSGSG
jgi:maltose O-acetyltransferase